MPVRRREYRRWEGELGDHRLSWFAILQNGLRLGMKQKHATLVLWAGIPAALLAGLIFYLLVVVGRGGEGAGEAGRFLGGLLQVLALHGAGVPRLAEMTVPAWHLVFLRLVNYQLLLVVVVHAKFSADLISGDLRTRALPIYFSKPITPATYLLGKWMVAFVLASAVILVPNLLAYTAGVLVSDTFVRLRETGGLFLRLVVLSVGIAGVSSLIVLAISALIRDRRAVAVAWIALILVASLAQGIFDENSPGDIATGPVGAVSLYRNAMRFSYWVLDIDRVIDEAGQRRLMAGMAGSDIYGSGTSGALVALGGLTALSLIVCLKRVHRFQVAATSA